MSTPRIHPDTIEDVKQRADIYDLVSERVVLKRRGKDFVGLCPFHEEKTPSFTVSSSKQMYYCFGCGAGGNSIKFLMELDQRAFSDVVLDLARRYQVPVKTETPEKSQEFQHKLSLREQLYEILAITTRFYEHALRQPQGIDALEYLKSERRLSEATIQQFKLGYAPAGWETLFDYLVEQKHFPVELVEQAGLIVSRKNGSGYYDRFRNRLIIPIHDTQGRVIGFGGRTLSDEQPKYLNSPETELFNKGKTLFGLDRAKTAISKQDQAVVVEGYFDVIALHAAGIENVVASLGTALSLNQVRQLLRYTESKQILLNFDADAAGTKATNRAIGELESLTYQGTVQLRILNLPEGKDSDEFLQSSSAEQYQELISNAPLWLDWQISQMLVGRDLNKVIEAQQVSQEMTELLRKMDARQQSHYIQRCAEILSQQQSQLVPIFAKSLQTQIRRIRLRDDVAQPQETVVDFSSLSEGTLLEQAEACLLLIYLHYCECRQLIADALESQDLQFCLSHYRFLWLKILEIETLAQQNVSYRPEDLISKLQDAYLEIPEKFDKISNLFYLDETSRVKISRPELVVKQALVSMELSMCHKRRNIALKMLKETDTEANRELGHRYWQQISDEYQRIKELEKLRITSIQDLISVPLRQLTDH